MLKEAEGKLGALTEVFGGTCVIANMCPAKFACVGCAGNAPDPSKRYQIEQKKAWAEQQLRYAVREKLAGEEREHLSRLEARYRQLLQHDPQLESRPTFLFFKGAANGLFAAGAERLANGVDARQALMIGIRCERGSHRFFKRYGDKFEDSEGKKIFLEFADEERSHLELLIREYRALAGRRRRVRVAKRRPRREAAVVR